MLALCQAAEPGEENPDRGRRDPCDRVRDEEAGGFFPGEIRGEARLSEGSSMMENCICVFHLTEESPFLTFLFTMTLTSAFCYCPPPPHPRLSSERGASQLAGTLQRPVGGNAQALPVLPQEGAAQNRGGVRAHAGKVPGDEAREEMKLHIFFSFEMILFQLPP